MSLHRRAARRDHNEAAIVEALRAAGASVTPLSVDGVPDLLVGYAGRNHLLEVKGLTVTGKTVRFSSRGKRPDERGLHEDQQAWWAAWRGAPPVIVRTPAEALAAIGARGADRGDAAAVVREVEAQTRSVTVLPGRIR